MSIQFRSKDLSPVEISFLKWQYGFEEEDDPFERSLWHTILHAWEADRQAFMSNSPSRTFKSDQGESFWNDLIKRAGLADRRKDNVVPIAERRRRTGSRG